MDKHSVRKTNLWSVDILKKISQILFYLSVILLFSGCNGCGYFYVNLESLDKNNATSGSNGNNSNDPNNEILELTRLSLSDPQDSPSDDTTPTFSVEGFYKNSTIKLYNDSSCSTTSTSEVSISNSDLSTSVLLTTSSLSSNGNYNFSAQAFSNTDSTKTSNCISLDSPYILDTDQPTLSSVNPNLLTTTNGGLITLTGSHFVHNANVKIGRSLCLSTQFISSTQINCTAPPYSETILDVTITKPNGKSATLHQSLTYETRPPKAPVCFADTFLDTISALKADPVHNTLYVGGSFHYIGQCSGGGVPLDLNSGVYKVNYGNFPLVLGKINSTVADGSGGYFIGGKFESVGGQPRYNLAHILSDMTLDPDIGVTTMLNDEIESLEYDSENARLYLAGKFTTRTQGLNSQGAIIDFNGNLNFNQNKIIGEVITSIPDGSGGFYIGGEISWIGGIPVSGLAHLLNDGSVDTLFLPASNNKVRSLLLTNGTLFAGGDFTQIGGSPRNYIAALSATTGMAAGSWNPNSNNIVKALAMSDNGTELYVGGTFTTIGGQSRGRVAKLNIGNGAVDGTWNPNAIGGSSTSINTIIVSGSTIYLGGDFCSVGGLTRCDVAAVNNTNGNAYTFDPHIDAFSISVNSLFLDNNTLFIGGYMQTVWSNLNKLLLAEINITSGTLVRPDVSLVGFPRFNIGLTSLAKFNSNLLVGGGFDLFSNNFESGLAAVDLTTGTYINWPTPTVNDQVNTISVSGSNIFIGGKFTSIGSTPQRGFMALDLITKQPLSNLNLNCSNLGFSKKILKKVDQDLFLNCGLISSNGTFINNGSQLARINLLDFSTSTINTGAVLDIRDLEVTPTTLYIAGSFYSILGQTRNNIAAIDLSSGSLTSWNPNISGDVNSIELSGNTLFAGGDFNTAGGKVRYKLAAIDLSTGTVLNTFNLNFNNSVNEVKVHQNNLYVGGKFISPRLGLISLDITSGTINLDWNPKVSPAVSTFAIQNDTMYVGGSFKTVDSVSRNNFASLDLTTGDATAWNPNADNYVFALETTSTRLFAGGMFNKMGTITRNGMAAFDLSTGTLITNWAPDLNYEPRDLKYIAPLLYLGGSFTTINSIPRRFLAAIDPTTGSLSSWDPDPDYQVFSIEEGNNSLFIGGIFFNWVGGQSRRYLAEIDLTTGLATPWNPDPNSHVMDIFKYNNSLYAVGNFTTINGQDHKYIAEINTSTGLPTAWDPKAMSAINKVFRIGNTVYSDGFKFWGSKQQNRLSALDATTGTLLNWSPQNNNFSQSNNEKATAFHQYNDILFIGGNFTSFQGLPRDLVGISLTTGSIVFPQQ